MPIHGSKAHQHACLGIPVIEQIAYWQSRISTKVAEIAKLGHVSLCFRLLTGDSAGQAIVVERAVCWW